MTDMEVAKAWANEYARANHYQNECHKLRAELAKARSIDVDELEMQIAADLESALCDGRLSPDRYVKDNRDTIRQLILKAIK